MNSKTEYVNSLKDAFVKIRIMHVIKKMYIY